MYGKYRKDEEGLKRFKEMQAAKRLSQQRQAERAAKEARSNLRRDHTYH